MSRPTALTLTEKAWEEISRHGVETFPEECCGVILYNGKTDEVRRCTNIQNTKHAENPELYPRDATIAYCMDDKEFGAIMREAESTGAAIKAFYHSHPQHGAYFSEEDKASACALGEPTYPESAQIVISIYDRVVREICTYVWAPDKKDFVEIRIRKISSP